MAKTNDYSKSKMLEGFPELFSGSIIRDGNEKEYLSFEIEDESGQGAYSIANSHDLNINFLGNMIRICND